MPGKRKYITKEQFANLQLNDKVLIRYMIGDAYIAGEPKDDIVLVTFKSGTWNGSTLEVYRQQIAHEDWGKKSFQER
jgi:hypothetical protein